MSVLCVCPVHSSTSHLVTCSLLFFSSRLFRLLSSLITTLLSHILTRQVITLLHCSTLFSRPSSSLFTLPLSCSFLHSPFLALIHIPSFHPFRFRRYRPSSPLNYKTPSIERVYPRLLFCTSSNLSPFFPSSITFYYCAPSLVSLLFPPRTSSSSAHIHNCFCLSLTLTFSYAQPQSQSYATSLPS